MKNGEKFDAVAREMSEDKAKSGRSLTHSFFTTSSLSMAVDMLTRVVL